MNRQGSTCCVGCDVITGVGHLKQILHNTLSFLSFREAKVILTMEMAFFFISITFLALNEVPCNCFEKRNVLNS